MISFRQYTESADTGKGNYASIKCKFPDIIAEVNPNTGKINKDPHVTLIYSKESDLDPSNVLETLNKNKGIIVAEVIGAAKFDSTPKEGERDDNLACIVLKLKSQKLDRIHKDLKEMGLTHSYPDFSPHLTLYYNVDREEAENWVKTLNKNKDVIGSMIELKGFESANIITGWNESRLRASNFEDSKSPQDKELKRLMESLKREEKMIISREMAWNNGTYNFTRDLYITENKRSKDTVDAIKSTISKMTGR